jgi:hypothetical protein
VDLLEIHILATPAGALAHHVVMAAHMALVMHVMVQLCGLCSTAQQPRSTGDHLATNATSRRRTQNADVKAMASNFFITGNDMRAGLPEYTGAQ